MASQTKTGKNERRNSLDLGVLAALGFGPEAALLHEPKLLVDLRFLSTLLAEFEQELGREDAGAAFFQIGLMMGLRDACRAVDSAQPAAMRLAIDLGPLANEGGLAFAGTWPERFEAEARLHRAGSTAGPSCALSAGYTSGWLSGILDARIEVREQQCAARGDEHCTFVAREVESFGDLDFDTFREVAAGDHPSPVQEAPAPDACTFGEGEFDPDAPVVHVWGPVMVIPFLGGDDIMQTVETLGHDAGLRQVRAVVVDLRDAILEEGLEAAALEHVLCEIEAWGAEAILTGVSPLSEAVIGSLEGSHLFLRKDLPEAIAAAFQIADAQRYAV